MNTDTNSSLVQGGTDAADAGRHILLAEDDGGLLSSLAFILESRGHRVVSAVDGLEALDRLREQDERGDPVDLLITDIQMPCMNGLRLIRNVASMKGSDFPIIVITGHGNKEMVVELMRMGCDDFLDKPFEPDDVHEKVREVMGRRRRTDLERDRSYQQAVARGDSLEVEATDYRRRFEELRGEVDRAKGAYQGLISLRPGGYRAPVAYRHLPLHDLGGDYLDVCDSEEGVDLLVADVAGHDMAASYQTIQVKASFREHCKSRRDGRRFMQDLNRDLMESGSGDRMVTAVLARLDFRAGEAELVTAGHPKAIRQSASDGVARRIPGRGSPLGLQSEVRFASTTLPTLPGDRIFLYTDGVVGARQVDGHSGARTRLGEEGLMRLINDTAMLSLGDQVDRIMEGVQRFCRFKQTDDMLLLGVEVPQAADGVDDHTEERHGQNGQ